MSYTQTLSRMSQLGMPKHLSTQLTVEIQKWIKSSGPEWTIQRLKMIKLMYIKYLSGQPYQPEWVKSYKNGIPKGPFCNLFKAKPSRRIFYILLAYTSLVSKVVTKSQAEKFFTSVKSEPVQLIHIPELKSVAEDINQLMKPRKICTYRDYTFSQERFAPDTACKSVPETIDILYEDIKTSVVWDFLDDESVGPVIQDSLGDLYIRLTQSFKEEIETPFVGKISVIQEPGFKARWIANPRRIFQIALMPLGNQLFSVLKHLPWDCTYDQLAGVEWLRNKLSQSVTVHSVDLSDATNNFPLELQMRFLRWIPKIHEEDLGLFERVSKAPWFIPSSIQKWLSVGIHSDNRLNWTKGQPLGLYPSFPAFALTHGALVRAIEKSLKMDNTFRILGDDIVIANDEVFAIYRKYLDLLQVPVSEQKTISSNTVGEFAGTLVFKDKIFESHKWRASNKNNVLSIVASLPRRLEVSDRTEFLGFVLRTLPRPFGLGDNSLGLPLAERGKLLLPLFLEFEETTDTLVRHTHDKSFRSSKGYTQLWTEDEPCSRDCITKMVDDLPLLEKIRNEQFPFSGKSIYEKLDEIFQFSSQKIPPLLGVFRWKDIPNLALTYSNRLESHTKRDFLNLFRRKFEKGQRKIVDMSPQTVEDALRRCMDAIFLDEWKIVASNFPDIADWYRCDCPKTHCVQDDPLLSF